MSSFESDEKPSFSSRCPNCCEIYRVTDVNSLHIPLILNCNHSCCESCIRDSIYSSKGQVVCRRCGHRSVIKSGTDPSMRNLRDNFPIAERIVHEMRAAQKPRVCDESQISFSFTLQPKKNVDPIKPADVPITVCNECLEGIPVLKCLECDEPYFCQKCSDDLHALRTRSHHVVIPLTEDAASCASDSSGSVYLEVKELEHQQILQELLLKSDLKIKTIQQSLQVSFLLFKRVCLHFVLAMHYFL